LMIYSCIILCSRIHPYGDSDPLARSFVRTTRAVVTSESIHDIGIVLFCATFDVVIFMKVEM